MLKQTKATKFTNDRYEGLFAEKEEFKALLAEREQNSIWFTDEDSVKLNELKVIPVYGGIFVDSVLSKVQNNPAVTYASSKEACEQVAYDKDFAPDGTSQLVQIKTDTGTYVYPLGASAIKGLADRAAIKLEGYENLKYFTPNSLSLVLNECFRAGGQKSLTILVQDGKVRAVNSGKYAICPTLFVAEAQESWVRNNFPKAKFISGFYSHEFVRWIYDLSAYTNQILGKYQNLIRIGMTPAVITTVSNIGTSAVAFQPALKNGVGYVAIGDAIAVNHVASGSSRERTDKIKQTVLKNIESIFVNMDKALGKVSEMEKIPVSNAINALLRGLKALGIPKPQALEAANIFDAAYSDGMTTAYDCLLAVIDAATFVIRDFPNDERKALEVSDATARATKINWRDLGNIPGSFKW